MQRTSSFTLPRVLTILAALLIWKVTLSAVIEYRNYVPPNFESDFLRGREPYFWAHTGGLSTRIWSRVPRRSCSARFWSAIDSDELFRPGTGGWDACKPPVSCCSWHPAVSGWPITRRRASSPLRDLARWR